MFKLSYTSDNSDGNVFFRDMQYLVPQLKQLGLTGYEASVYAALLEHSPASASFVAKKCGLSRSSVYTTLNTLMGKGLVGTTYKNEIKQFIAQDKSSLEQLLRKEEEILSEKFQAFESLRDALDRLGASALSIPQLIFFEGQEGLKKIYLSMMREAPDRSTLYLLRDEFVWRPDWDFIFKPEWMSRVRRIKSEKDIRTRLLVNDSKEERERLGTYGSRKDLDVRFLPRKYSVDRFALYVMGDTVSLLSMEHNNLVGVKMANAHFSENFRRLFDGLWDKSKKAKY
jgi:sugar-specific transcriptional regulator TrmB